MIGSFFVFVVLSSWNLSKETAVFNLAEIPQGDQFFTSLEMRDKFLNEASSRING